MLKKLIIIVLGLATIYFAYHYSKHIVGDEELWVEKVIVDEGGFIKVYHSHKCLRSKPLYIEKEDKIDFKKTKFSVYDICIPDDEVEMLNSISKTNINRVLERGWVTSEDIESFVRYEKEICDLSNRDYDVSYSWIGRGTKKLSKPIEAWLLLDETDGRKFKW